MAKDECEGRTKISIFWLRRNGHLSPKTGWRAGSLSWSYTSTGEDAGSLSYQMQINSLEPNAEVGHIRLMYKNTSWRTGEETDMDYEIPIVTTACNYSGIRFWFRCPLYSNGVYCGRRVGVLYKISKYYGCRDCGDLVYADQNESKLSRGMVCCPDLDKAYDGIKRFYYKGRPTKRYKKYLRKQQLFNNQIRGWVAKLASRL